MKIMKWGFVVALLAFPLAASAQEVVTQGQGNTTGSKPWRVNTSADVGGKTSEVCVTNAAGGTTITAFAGRRAIELQNLGPNAIFCTVDGQSPLATGALGRKIDASGGTWAIDAGPNITVKCIAATAAQVTTACTQVTEVK